MQTISTRSYKNIRETIRRYHRRDESLVINELMPQAELPPGCYERTRRRAHDLVTSIRASQKGKGGVDALLKEFSLSTAEGVVLMCLAEALLRVPDPLTADRLIRDKLSGADWSSHLGQSDSLFVNASAWGLLLTGKIVNFGDEVETNVQFSLLKQTTARLGEPVIRASVRYAMQIMGTQFVMGKTIGAAIERAQELEQQGYRYSYDMLGEGARSMTDADRYFHSYLDAIENIGRSAPGSGPIENSGLSVKLSAIHPRYTISQHQRVMDELVPRLKTLVLAAKQQDIGITVDAEEADRLDLSLDVIEAVFSDSDLDGWEGFGIAIQGYLKCAPHVIEWCRQIGENVGRKMMVRLVKGAYWDSEIKWSQTDGLDDYPVFTRKSSTDLCYQACVKLLLQSRDTIYPQFATHNAYTVAMILELDHLSSGTNGTGYEFQRLHGMGESLYDKIMPAKNVNCRIYAPVGEHADLLAYLVRRLLENGANSSFVNNILDDSVPIEQLLENPHDIVSSLAHKHNPRIPLPRDLYDTDDLSRRLNSRGLDLSDSGATRTLLGAIDSWWDRSRPTLPAPEAAGSKTGQVPVYNPARSDEVVGYVEYDTPDSMDRKLALVSNALVSWSEKPVESRARLLKNLADALEADRATLIGLCVKEAGKTIADSISEVREAVDFCRYYADEAEKLGPVIPRGVWLCISPWNFPLAIFLGQVTSALVTGNAVIAKPAEQTSLIALHVIGLMVQCGFPQDVIQLVISPGKPAGEKLVPDSRIKGVLFTGSTRIGHWLNRALAARDEVDIPLVAETGGQNAMIVDSTALPEQVIDDVVISGFMSAGQRCSALRVLFLQADIADKIINMLVGAMTELSMGDPGVLSTDIGPVIDTNAFNRLLNHRRYLADCTDRATLLCECVLPENPGAGHFFAPCLYEISDLSILKEEVFGPVVHIIRYAADELDSVIDQVNGIGYGLTLGVHSRIQTTTSKIARRARVGNVYVNRNMIGAVVGVQPFGGQGLSGTGPKAGGPHYLPRLVNPLINDQPMADRQARVGAGDVGSIPGNTAGSQTAQAYRSLVRTSIAQRTWFNTAFSERVATLREIASDLPDDIDLLPKSIDELFSRADKYLKQPLALSGPTGESNQLLLEGRGLIAVLVDSDTSRGTLIHQVLALLLAGNGAVLILQNGLKLDSIVGLFSKKVLADELVTVATMESLTSILNDPDLNGVIVGSFSHMIKPVQKVLADRQGAIIPLLLWQDGDADSESMLLRLCVEKTVTVDTTAAGGNASLMTAAEDP
ncbi:MAG: bifunctional proline dehydrogenase/L-glutamate gamma-semialdehyde dehydrogenase PutA [bacterium]